LQQVPAEASYRSNPLKLRVNPQFMLPYEQKR